MSTVRGVTNLAHDFQHNLGFQYAGLFLALISCLIGPIPFIFFYKGERIRQRSTRATQEASSCGSMIFLRGEVEVEESGTNRQIEEG